MDHTSIKALAFDVFGTVVDWRASIIREGELLGRRKGLTLDWARFADAWRAGYQPAMQRVRQGELGWTTIDDLHRMILDGLLKQFQITLSEKETEHLNRVWHRLMPWPDALAGLHRLKSRFVLATLSNGNVSLLVNLAKNVGLPWDCVLSGELFRHYKPDPEVYQGAARILGLQPAEVLMVAAHPYDLQAAKAQGLSTAFVPRPLERGPNGAAQDPAGMSFDVTAADFIDLAAKLGA